MSIQTIHTDLAPSAIGAYSQAVIANGFLFTAGQVGLDPATGSLVGSGLQEQVQQTLGNLNAILKEAGLNFGDVVKTTIYLTSIADFPVVNEIYAIAMGDARPARSTVQVAGLPLGARVEIDMVALVQGGGDR